MSDFNQKIILEKITVDGDSPVFEDKLDIKIIQNSMYWKLCMNMGVLTSKVKYYLRLIVYEYSDKKLK